MYYFTTLLLLMESSAPGSEIRTILRKTVCFLRTQARIIEHTPKMASAPPRRSERSPTPTPTSTHPIAMFFNGRSIAASPVVELAPDHKYHHTPQLPHYAAARHPANFARSRTPTTQSSHPSRHTHHQLLFIVKSSAKYAPTATNHPPTHRVDHRPACGAADFPTLFLSYVNTT